MLNPVSVNMQAVPRGLERYRQFINWRLTGDDKKLPCDIHGNIINAHDPVFWLSAHEAALSPHPIAFVFSERDPFWFIDLDDAWNGSQWSNLANYCMTFFSGCAVEISHSGTGLHLFGAGAQVLAPDHGCKNIKTGIELYTTGRFCALTGTNRAGDAWIDFSDRLPSFVISTELTPRDTIPSVEDDHTGADSRYTGPSDDDELIRLMCASKGSLKTMFGSVCHPRDLWEANRPALEAVFKPGGKRDDGLLFDWSSADAALMWHLSFWTGGDRERMTRLFQRSALYRPTKYEGKGAYRLPLVLKQGLRNQNVYDRPAAGLAVSPAAPGPLGSTPAAGTDRGGRSTMDLARQVEHFAGCVYVQAAHAIMVPDGRLLRPAVFNASYGGFSFQMQYDNGRPTHEAFTAFTENRMMRFPSVADVCFRPDRAPGEIIDGMVNTWVPPVIDEAPGDITRFLDHVTMMLPNVNDRRILFAYMQSLVRNPGRKFQWAPLIQGAEGNGKTMLIRVLTHAVGRKYSHLPKASQLTEKFNSWIEGRLFIGVEEIKVADRREVLEDLKDSVTNDWVEIRRMQQEKRMGNNFTNWLFCSNHKDAIPVNADMRRYAIFFSAQQTAAEVVSAGMTNEYFVALYAWLREGGGYQAIAHWLRHGHMEAVEYDPAGICQRAPATSSKIEAISVSLGKVEQTILEAVEDDVPGFRDGWISTGAVRQWLQTRGTREVNTNKMAEIIKSLGYDYRFKSSVKIIEENENRSRIYRKSSIIGGSQIEFLVAQNYSHTLRGGFPPLGRG